MPSTPLGSLFPTRLARAALLVLPALIAGCGSSTTPASASPTPTGTTAPSPTTASPPDPNTASATPSIALPTDPPAAVRWPDCETEPDPALCARVVDEVLGAGRFGTGHAPSDVLMDSSCSSSGCRGTLILITPDGFTLTAELASTGPRDPWRILSLVAEPGGPVPLPSAT